MYCYKESFNRKCEQVTNRFIKLVLNLLEFLTNEHSAIRDKINQHFNYHTYELWWHFSPVHWGPGLVWGSFMGTNPTKELIL